MSARLTLCFYGTERFFTSLRDDFSFFFECLLMKDPFPRKNSD